MERREEKLLREILETIERIEHKIEHLLQPRLVHIKIAFKGAIMATQGPVILTTAGQVTTASINGYDQFGAAWTGTIPPVSYAIDNTAVATSVPNADGLTDTVTAVANGVANLTASLTSAEGLPLTDTETVTVNIPAPPPPPPPVLTSIKIAFS